jgi:hypothetical protein
MSPIARIVDVDDPRECVSISLEHTQLILADLRSGLPELERQLRRKWPTLVRVKIEDVVPRRKNPIDATSARELATQVASAGLHLVAIFGAAVAARAGVAFGKEAMTPPAKEVGKLLKQWVQKFTKTKKRKRRRTRTTKDKNRPQYAGRGEF